MRKVQTPTSNSDAYMDRCRRDFFQSHHFRRVCPSKAWFGENRLWNLSQGVSLSACYVHGGSTYRICMRRTVFHCTAVCSYEYCIVMCRMICIVFVDGTLFPWQTAAVELPTLRLVYYVYIKRRWRAKNRKFDRQPTCLIRSEPRQRRGRWCWTEASPQKHYRIPRSNDNYTTDERRPKSFWNLFAVYHTCRCRTDSHDSSTASTYIIVAGTYRLDCNQVLLMVTFIIAVNVYDAVN